LHVSPYRGGLPQRTYATIGRRICCRRGVKEQIFQDRLLLIQQVTGVNSGRCMEIGCGNGAFLSMLKRHSRLDVMGLEPSGTYDLELDFPVLRMPLEQVNMREQGLSGMFDLVICRHVLEHVLSPRSFLKKLAGLVRNGGYLYLEVPSAEGHARQHNPVSGQNIHSLHLHHFNGMGLSQALTSLHIHPIHLDDSSSFGYPSLRLIAKKSSPPEYMEDLFRKQVELQTGKYRNAANKLHSLLERYPRAVFWGAGSDCAALLDNLGGHERERILIVDKNPVKQGKLLKGQPIHAPRALSRMEYDIIIITTSNKTLTEDIRYDVRAMNPGANIVSAFDE
jgi:SAM-dependent methyltransferase